jgi:hypothetical protein
MRDALKKSIHEMFETHHTLLDKTVQHRRKGAQRSVLQHPTVSAFVLGAVSVAVFRWGGIGGCKRTEEKKNNTKQDCVILTRLKQSCLSGRSRTGGRDCFRLANQYRKKGDATSLVTARRYYKYACIYGDRDGCHNLGLVYVQGKGGVRDLKAARRAFEKACELGEWGSCMNLATMQERGAGGKRDVKTAVNLLDRACNAKEYFACGKLAFLWAQGRVGAVDLVKAIRYADKGCRGEQKDCCVLAKGLRKRLESWKPGEKAFPSIKNADHGTLGDTLTKE